ncbi:DUF6538 domain-containing protein [Lichenihabitans psoromatis]
MGRLDPWITRRSGRLTFRRVVPVGLRQQVGKRELTRGLGTSDFRAARL